MLKKAKQACLYLLRAGSAFHLISRSKWRHRRLLILCYHGVADFGQEQWNGGLFLSTRVFENRLQRLVDGGFRVLGLREALCRVAAGTLPQKSVVLTFDDGLHNFYQVAWPILKRYQFPATVYLTTYYSSYNRPIFDLICGYLLWQARGGLYDARGVANLSEHLDLRSEAARAQALGQLKGWAAQQDLSGPHKDELAQHLAERLRIDYGEILRRRVMHLMNPDEIAELAAQGVDFQLHTHRHRMPLDRELLYDELEQNRNRIAEWTGHMPEHLCYPSGMSHPAHLPLLRECGIRSATTCQPGLITRTSHPLLLPRIGDHSGCGPIEFEAWLSGISALDPRCLWRERVGPRRLLTTEDKYLTFAQRMSTPSSPER